jgi:NurA-like 5'-3' nuclease
MSARIETAIRKLDEIQGRIDAELDAIEAKLQEQQLLMNKIVDNLKVYVEAIEASRKEPK